MTDTDLVRRLEKLERDNRRFKRLGFAALVLAVALGSIYAMRPVPDVIKAHRFEAVDSSGRVRVRVSALPDGGGIGVFDAEGAAQAVMNYSKSFGPSLALGMHSESGGSGGRYIPNVDIRDIPHEGPAILLGGSLDTHAAMVGLKVTRSGLPNITLGDSQGYIMQLGSTGTVADRTGATQQTSADSIIMFGNGKKHTVIWKAP